MPGDGARRCSAPSLVATLLPREPNIDLLQNLYSFENCFNLLLQFASLNKEKQATTELKSRLEKLVVDVRKVKLKEEEIERENKRNKESLEENKKWLSEQHKEGKTKWLIVPGGIVDLIGSFYSEERTINHFKYELVMITSELFKAADELIDGNYNKSNIIISELQFPHYPNFGLYKGWLLDSGESSQAFKLRMMTMSATKTDQIIFIDGDDK